MVTVANSVAGHFGRTLWLGLQSFGASPFRACPLHFRDAYLASGFVFCLRISNFASPMTSAYLHLDISFGIAVLKPQLLLFLFDAADFGGV